MRRFLSLAAAALAAASLAWMPAQPARAQGDPLAARAADQAYRAALDAYVYFYPLVTMDLTRRQATNAGAAGTAGHGPANTFVHARDLPDAGYKDVVRPNFDMLRSHAWLDLRNGPVVISVPDTHGRYYVLSLLDMWTDVFAALGKRTTGTGAGTYLVVPPGWSDPLPQGMTRIDAPTPCVWIVGYTQTAGGPDMQAARAVQDGYAATPLSAWNQVPGSVQLSSDPTMDLRTPPLEQVEKMSAEAYFSYAADLLRRNPAHATDQPMLARMRRVGLVAGQRFDFSLQPYATQQALRRAVREGRQYLRDRLSATGVTLRGWQMNTDTIGVYGNYYLKRAVVAQTRLGASLPEDMVAPLLLTDAAGRPMTGARNYVIHFDPQDLPPAGASWSINMYDAQGYAVPNPAKRYAVGDRAPIVYNPDGSLDIYVQRDRPADIDEPNWLPAADGPLSITMRVYSPDPAVLDGEWAPPAVREAEPAPAPTP